MGRADGTAEDSRAEVAATSSSMTEQHSLPNTHLIIFAATSPSQCSEYRVRCWKPRHGLQLASHDARFARSGSVACVSQRSCDVLVAPDCCIQSHILPGQANCVTMATFHHMPLLRSLGLAGEKKRYSLSTSRQAEVLARDGRRSSRRSAHSLAAGLSASAARSAALRLIAHTANRISSPINYSLCLFRSMNTLMARPSAFLSWFPVLSPSSHAARSTNARKESSHGLSLLFPQASVLVGSLCQP